MKIDSVITLENDLDCLLLEKVVYENKNYFLSVALNEDDEPTDDYVVFEEIVEGDETYVEKVEDAELLSKLVDEFAYSLDKEVDKLIEKEA